MVCNPVRSKMCNLKITALKLLFPGKVEWADYNLWGHIENLDKM